MITVTERAALAFIAGDILYVGKTSVRVFGGMVYMYYEERMILRRHIDAMIGRNPKIQFSLAGMPTQAVKRRINAVIKKRSAFCANGNTGNKGVYQRDGFQYYNDERVYIREWYSA